MHCSSGYSVWLLLICTEKKKKYNWQLQHDACADQFNSQHVVQIQLVTDTQSSRNCKCSYMVCCKIDNVPKARLNPINQSLCPKIACHSLIQWVQVGSCADIHCPASHMNVFHFWPLIIDFFSSSLYCCYSCCTLDRVKWDQVGSPSNCKVRWSKRPAASAQTRHPLPWHYALKSLLITCDETLM